MINVELTPEPPDFDVKVRQPGLKWLAENTDGKRPRAYWREVMAEVERVFEGRCAYAAMVPMTPGTIDHFVSIDEDRRLTYEWLNYRFASHWINSKKSMLRSAQILDPCQIGDDWFEIVLPGFQLRVTETCPEPLRERARFTLARLGLDHHKDVVRFRKRWYEMYERGLPMEELERCAPLVARAIRKGDAAGVEASDPRPSVT
jgi:hypothetical protein